MNSFYSIEELDDFELSSINGGIVDPVQFVKGFTTLAVGAYKVGKECGKALYYVTH